jgi:predicted transcriptional regulator
MKKLREEGLGISTIATEVQMADSTVRKYLKEGQVT